MRLCVKNWGPLREAEIDLSKRLVVLAGPSDLGKRYLAWGAYGLSWLANAPAMGAHLEAFLPHLGGCVEGLLRPPASGFDLRLALADAHAGLLEAIAAAFREELPTCFARERDAFAGVELTLSADGHTRSAARRFGEQEGFLLWFDFGPSIAVLLPPGEVATGFGLWLLDAEAVRGGKGGLDPDELRSRLRTLASDPSARRSPASLSPDEAPGFERALGLSLGEAMLHQLLPFGQAVFPTERAAVNLFAEELKQVVREPLREPWGELPPSDDGLNVRRHLDGYPWPVREVVRASTWYVENLTSPFADLTEELEGTILGGRVFPSVGGPVFAPATSPGRRQRPIAAGPRVASLAGLAVYFRHRAIEGDLVVIEEPELGLSPREQRAMARLIAKAVGRGFRLVITTQSDYIARELSNLIVLDRLFVGEARALGFDLASALPSEAVGVYHLGDGVAHPVPVDETGFSIDAPDETLNALEADERKLRGRADEGR